MKVMLLSVNFLEFFITEIAVVACVHGYHLVLSHIIRPVKCI